MSDYVKLECDATKCNARLKHTAVLTACLHIFCKHHYGKSTRSRCLRCGEYLCETDIHIVKRTFHHNMMSCYLRTVDEIFDPMLIYFKLCESQIDARIARLWQMLEDKKIEIEASKENFEIEKKRQMDRHSTSREPQTPAVFEFESRPHSLTLRSIFGKFDKRMRGNFVTPSTTVSK